MGLGVGKFFFSEIFGFIKGNSKETHKHYPFYFPRTFLFLPSPSIF